MIIIDEINGEIAKLETQTQTWQTIERLAWLYTVRDHNTIPTSQLTPSEPGIIQVDSTSPFLSKCAGNPTCEIMAIMDELMTTLQVLMPKLYDSVMRRLQ